MYRCEAQSEEAFVQQLACNLVNHGYWLYTVGTVPPGKDVYAVDQKLIKGYAIEMSKWQRARRKAEGEAKLSYLRYDRVFILIATEGEHIFKRREKVSDICRKPFRIGGYSIGCSKGSDGRYHASVKIEPETFGSTRSYLLGLAVHRRTEALIAEFRKISFTPYARVRRQLLRLLREVNEARAAAGFEAVPLSALNLRRRPVKVFAAGPEVSSTGGSDLLSCPPRLARLRREPVRVFAHHPPMLRANWSENPQPLPSDSEAVGESGSAE